VREQGTKFCVGTPDDCIHFLELYQALGIEEVIPYFAAKEPRVAVR
jgi:hypothetical protein